MCRVWDAYNIGSTGDAQESRSWNKNSSGDEITNVNFLYDDIVHVLAHKFRHRSTLFVARHRPMTVFTAKTIHCASILHKTA